MDLKMTYTIILGRPFLRKTKVVESMHFLKLKFRASEGIDIVKGIRRLPKHVLQSLQKGLVA